MTDWTWSVEDTPVIDTPIEDDSGWEIIDDSSSSDGDSGSSGDG